MISFFFLLFIHYTSKYQPSSPPSTPHTDHPPFPPSLYPLKKGPLGDYLYSPSPWWSIKSLWD